MPKGGARSGAGRKAGGKNKATIEREILAAQQIDAVRRGERRLAVAEMERALQIAEGFAGANQPEPIKDANGRVVQLKGGDIKLFGEWFDRWTFLLKELAKYQSPQIKAIEAPTPPPDPADAERKNRRRFGLRVFDGGRPVPPLGAASVGAD
jgi:hypothetical protein